MRRYIIFSFIGIMFFLLLGLVSVSAGDFLFQASPTPFEGIPTAVVSVDFVLAEPRQGALNLDTLSGGEPVTVLGVEESLEWYYVRTQAFIHGWVKAETILLNEAEILQLVVFPIPEPSGFGGRRNVALGCGQVELAFTNTPIYLVWRIGAATRVQVESIADSLTLNILLNDLAFPGAPTYGAYRLSPERYSQNPEIYGISWRIPLGVLPPGVYTIFHEYQIGAVLDETVEIGLDGETSTPQDSATCQIIVTPPEGFTVAAVPTESIVVAENLFFEPFDNNLRDWRPYPSFFTTADGRLDIGNGVMEMEVTTIPAMQSDVFLHSVLPGGTRYVDFAANVEVTSLVESDSFTYELWFKASEDAVRGYVFRVDPNQQQYSLGFRFRNSWQKDIISATPSEEIKPTGANTLGVIVIGTQIDLYINGTLVNSVRNAELSSGTLLLSVTAYDGQALPAVAQFDNVRVSNDIALIFEEIAFALTSTPRSTDTPIPTDTPTPTNTPTFTPTLTATFTPLPTDTASPTATFTNTATPTSTFTASPTVTFTPMATATNTPSPTPVVIPNVPVSRGGIEVFPRPEKVTAERLFAAVQTDFAPYVAGRTADSQWVYLYYFDGTELQDGWALARQLQIPSEQIATLSVIDPQSVPPFPDLPYTEAAQRPGR